MFNESFPYSVTLLGLLYKAVAGNSLLHEGLPPAFLVQMLANNSSEELGLRGGSLVLRTYEE